jgi:hypothetical protein
VYHIVIVARWPWAPLSSVQGKPDSDLVTSATNASKAPTASKTLNADRPIRPNLKRTAAAIKSLLQFLAN